MGFLDFVEAAKKDIGTRIARLNNAKFATAAMSVCALVAAADGSVSSSEKQKLGKALAVNPLLAVFDQKDLQSKFLEACKELEDDLDFGKINLLANIRKLKGTEEAPDLIRLGMIIGSSDGNFDDKEKAVVAEITKELGLNPADFGLPVTATV